MDAWSASARTTHCWRRRRRTERSLVLGILSVALSVAGPKILGEGTNIIFAGFISLQVPAGVTKQQVIDQLVAAGNQQQADMLSAMDFTPGAGIDFAHLGAVIVAVIAVYVLLERTHAGLRLKAVGLNRRAAFLLGVPTWQYALLAFLLCGALAGLAGAVQVTGVYHRLIPSISSGYGFLGLMIGMLIAYKAVWVAPVALFFAALNIGSIQLPIVLKLDSTLSGVLQGALVLFVLLVEGFRQRYLRRARLAAAAVASTATVPPPDGEGAG